MNLWGDEFVVESSIEKSKKALNKVNSPKKVQKKESKISIEEKLFHIEKSVHKILGKYADSTVVIKSKKEYDNYIEKCIEIGTIALDTETNNSLDPLTCKLMGLCLYAEGMPAAYIPVNHTNKDTGERLSWQLTEEDIKEGIDKLVNVKIITHNGKFDYKVLKCTCNCTFSIYWDSQVAARILDENEYSAGLKQQYIMKIDPTEEKYSIDHLFEGLEYAIIDPELFALYAATDSYKTYVLYKYQFKELIKPENKRLLSLLYEVEFPIIEVVSEMELDGIALDKEYCERLSKKYHQKLDVINEELNKELENLKPQITAWKLTPYAQEKAFRIVKGKEVQNKKTRAEQLEDPPALTSPTQLAILLYDILKVSIVDKNNPRGTGEDILKQIDLPIVKLIIEQRTLLKLLDAFIDALPKLASERDGKIHSNFNQLGTDTGRFSCTNPNLQQIPARNIEVRMMFCADDYEVNEEIKNNCITLYINDDIMLYNGTWKKVLEVEKGDEIFNNNEKLIVYRTEIKDKEKIIYFCD